MDEIMKGVKIGKLLGKDEKKETCKVIAIVVGVVVQKKDSYRGSEALYSCFFANNENNTLDWR